MHLDLSGLGAVLVGIAAVIGSTASFIMTIKNTKKIRNIDHAVNGRAAGSQTMQSQVSDLHSTLPPPPPEVNGEALLPLMRMLVADMYDRRKQAQ